MSSDYVTQTPLQILVNDDDWENVTERLLERVKDIARRAERFFGIGNITDNLDARRFAVETSEQFKKALEELERYRNIWKDAVATKKGELSTLEPRLTRLKANVQEKEQELEDLRVAIKTEQDELQGQIASKQLIDGQVGELAGELETLRKEKNEATIQINKNKAQNEMLVREEQRLQTKEQELDIRERSLEDKETAQLTTGLELEGQRIGMNSERDDLTASRFILRNLLGKTGTVVSVDTQLGASVSDLQTMSTAIDARCKHLDTEKANALARLSLHRIEHDKDKRQIAHLSGELGESRVECEQNASAAETLQIEVQCLREKLDGLKEQVSSKEKEVVMLTQEKQTIKDKLVESEEKVKTMRKDLDIAQEAVIDAKDQLQESQAENGPLKTRLDVQTCAAEHVRVKLRQTEKERDNIKGLQIQATADIAGWKEQSNANAAKLAGFEEKLTTSNDEIIQLTADMQGLQARHEQLTHEKDNWKGEAEKTTIDLEISRKKLEPLEAQLIALKKAHQQAVDDKAALTGQLNEAKKAELLLKERNTVLAADLLTITGQHEALKPKLDRKIQRLDEMEIEKNELQLQLDEVQGRVDNLDAENDRMEAMLRGLPHLEAENVRLQEELTHLRTTRTIELNKQREITGQLAQLNGQVKTMTDEATSKDLILKEVHNSLDRYESANLALQETVDRSKEGLRLAEKTVGKYKTEIAEITAKYANAQKLGIEINEAKIIVDAECHDLRVNSQMLEATLDDKEAEVLNCKKDLEVATRKKSLAYSETAAIRKKYEELRTWCSTIQEKNMKALQISNAAKESFDNIMDVEVDSAFKLKRERQLLREIYNERLFLIH